MAGRYGSPAEFGILQGYPADDAGRAVITQELLDGGVDERGISPQPGQLFWMTQQRDDGVADQVRGCLVPGHQQQRARGYQFLLGEYLAVLVGLHKQAEQVIGRPGAAPADTVALPADPPCPSCPWPTRTTASPAPGRRRSLFERARQSRTLNRGTTSADARDSDRLAQATLFGLSIS